MRSAVILLMFLSISTAYFQFSYPPVSSIMSNNSGAHAAALEGYYNASNAYSSSVNVILGPYNQYIPVSVDVEIAGLSLTLDNTSYPEQDLGVVFARGTQNGHLISFPGSGPNFVCDYAWFQQSGGVISRCDFDSDSCAEYENSNQVTYDVLVNFNFRNKSVSTAMSSTFVKVPSEIMEEMSNSSGSEQLVVSLTGNILVIYEINNRKLSGLSCTNNLTNFSVSIPVSISRSFPMSGKEKLFFMRSPLLREQWYQNNHFDIVVLSQSPIYKFTNYKNGSLLNSVSTASFYVESDNYGLEKIVTNRSYYNSTVNSSSVFWSEYLTNLSNSSDAAHPFILEISNMSFAYVYGINSTYLGLGYHNLTLEVADSFSNQASFSDIILSRQLSYNGNLAEAGGVLDNSSTKATTRPSAPFLEDSLVSLTLSLGLIAVVLMLSFINFWTTGRG